MCGLAGIAGPGANDPAALEAMARVLRHRGPDGTHFLAWRAGAALEQIDTAPRMEGATVALAHNRLSIIDLAERSDQPYVDGELALVYNGEIYNYIELRAELERLGHSFRTEGDTEVVLAAYRQWGRDAVTRFVGMWAFALLDAGARTLLLSRDRFGIKPLYWALHQGSLVFASEIKGLLEIGVSREPNEAIARRYLLTGQLDETPQTFFSAIAQLPPAHDAVVDLADPARPLAPRRYWAPPETASARLDEPDAEELFLRLLRESVRVHARSDVQVGTCLSGGLDSSAIVCVAEELRQTGTIPSYAHHAIGYVPGDPALSEESFMHAVTAQTGVELTLTTPTAEAVATAIEDVIRSQDEPFGSASIAAQWFVFRAAAEQGLKVMLDGQGSDEMLAGYGHYVRVLAEERARDRRPLRYAQVAHMHRRMLGERALPPALLASAVLRGWNVRPMPSSPPPAAELLSAGARGRSTSSEWAVRPPLRLTEVLRRDTTATSVPALLRYEDRNSMAYSVEARVPFLDHRLAEFALTLPSDLKVRGTELKSIMRRALAGVVPEAVRTRRDKVGFRAEPRVTWLLAERDRDSLSRSATSIEDALLNPAAVARMLDRRGGSEVEYALWRVINLKLWARLVAEPA